MGHASLTFRLFQHVPDNHVPIYLGSFPFPKIVIVIVALGVRHQPYFLVTIEPNVRLVGPGIRVAHPGVLQCHSPATTP